MPIYRCKSCGSVVVGFSLDLGTMYKKIRDLFRAPRIRRIKTRLGFGDKFIAFFPRTYSHNVEYSFFRDGEKIKVESYNFNYLPEYRLKVKEFDSWDKLIEWTYKIDFIAGYHLSKEAANWLKETETMGM